MKITIEIDCSPEEARTYMGLPDVKPMQEAVMGQMEKQATQAVQNMAPDAMLKQWFTALPMLSNQMQELFTRMLSNASGKG